MRDIPYRQTVGSLLWLAFGTRPDISAAAGQVAKFNANLKIFRYLKFTGYSPWNVDNQLVIFRSANDLGGLGNPILSGFSDGSL